MFIAGRVIQGLCTSLLLIAAVPPLAIGYPASKLRDDGGDHEHVHLRRRRARPVRSAACRPRRTPGGRCSGSSPAIAVVGPRPGRADLRGRAARRSRLAARPAGDRARARSAASPRSSAPRSSPATASSTRSTIAPLLGGLAADRRPGRLPVPRQAAAADDPHHAHQHDPGRGHRCRAVRRGRVGLGDRADRRGAGRPLQPAAHRRSSTCPSSPAR